MMTMSAPLQWTDVALRLLVTVVVGLAVGYDRSEHGKAAGMRTTLMVCLAASVAMIEVNVLLPMAGRTSDSFVMNDLMRLPLGILTGVGFIGGGAILHRGNIVVGVTTAATLWLVTVIGLCVGGGQIELGLAVTVLALFALRVMGWIERRLKRERRGRFLIELDASGPSETEIRHRLNDSGLSIDASQLFLDGVSRHRKFVFEVREFQYIADTAAPGFVDEFANELGVLKLEWRGSL